MIQWLQSAAEISAKFNKYAEDYDKATAWTEKYTSADYKVNRTFADSAKALAAAKNWLNKSERAFAKKIAAKMPATASEILATQTGTNMFNNVISTIESFGQDVSITPAEFAHLLTVAFKH